MIPCQFVGVAVVTGCQTTGGVRLVVYWSAAEVYIWGQDRVTEGTAGGVAGPYDKFGWPEAMVSMGWVPVVKTRLSMAMPCAPLIELVSSQTSQRMPPGVQGVARWTLRNAILVMAMGALVANVKPPALKPGWFVVNNRLVKPPVQKFTGVELVPRGST